MAASDSLEEKLPAEKKYMYFPRKREGRQRLRKRRTERDFDLGEKTEDIIRSHFRVDNKQVSECYAFEINFHVLFHLAIHILMILLCYYLSKN